MSLKDKLLARLLKPPVTPVTFDGVDCFIKHWSENEKVAFSLYCQELKEEGKDSNIDNLFRCRVLAWSLCDAEGNLLFGKDEQDKIAEFPTLEIGRVFNEIIEVQKEPDTETAKKNSGTNHA